MKIPVYKEKLARTKTSGGGAFLQAQVNPNAWGAMGTALSGVGDMVTKIGMEKYKIQATSDVNETIPLFVAALKTIEVNYANQTNPVEAEKKVKAKMMNVYKKFSNGNMKKTGEGTPYLSSNLSKRLFSTKASQLVTNGILAWKKANNAHIVELNKLNETNAIRLNDKDASNTSLSLEVRDAALERNFSKGSLYKKVEGQNQNFGNYIGMPSGKYAENAEKGTFKSKEFLTMQKKSLETIVTGISLNLIKSKTHPSMSVTEVLVKGDLKQLTEVDPILAKVWGKLDPQDKLDFIKKVRTLENNRKKDVEDAKKEKADVLKAGDEKLKIEIINADYSNPKAKAAAFIKFKKLLKNEVFEKSAERNALGKYFEEDETGGEERKTLLSTLKILDALDDQNKLTKKAINDVSSTLSLSDYKLYINKYKTEKSDAENYVINTIINGSFFIDEINSDDDSEAEFDKMRISSKNAFNKWIATNGSTSNYEEIISKGGDIMKSPKEQIAKMYKAGFDNEVMKFKAVPNLKNSFEKKYLDKKYTLNRIMSHLVDLGLSKAQPLSYSKRFKQFLGLPGANEWNN